MVPDDMTDMHIHGAPEGETGDVIFDFSQDDDETEIDADAGTVTGSWDVDEADGAATLTDEDVAALLAEETYFNVHTNRDSSGFIRGQILRGRRRRRPDRSYRAQHRQLRDAAGDHRPTVRRRRHRRVPRRRGIDAAA